MNILKDSGIHHTLAIVDKWDADQVRWVERKSGITSPIGAVLRTYVDPYETLEVEGNLITTNGLGRLTNFLIGTGSLVGFTATTTGVAVGDSSTAAAAADADLVAATNKYYKTVDSAPTRGTTTVTNDTVQCVATFGSSQANFVWNEWGTVLASATTADATTLAGFSSASDETLFNRKVASMGTKGSGSSWTVTAKIAWS